jgi:hypothetical protein
MRLLYPFIPVVLGLTLASCTITTMQKRGDMMLQGTIFEGWEVESNPDSVAANQIAGSYYSCRKVEAPSTAGREFACVLTLPDGDRFDGSAFEEQLTVAFRDGGDLKSMEIQTIRPGESSEDHFRFRLDANVAQSLESVTGSVPVRISE